MVKNIIIFIAFVGFVSALPKPMSVKDLTPIVKSTCQDACKPETGPKTK